MGRPDTILEIIYPKDGEPRARRVISRSNSKSTYMHSSWKHPLPMLHAESPAERIAMILLDADPSVIAYREQPLTIKYLLDGVVHLHYPDLFVQRLQRNELLEVKDKVDHLDEFTLRRTEFLSRALGPVGFNYRLVIAAEMKKGPGLNNSLELTRFGRWPVAAAERERIRQILNATGAITWGSALNGDLGPRGKKTLCRLILEGVLGFDQSEPITAATRLTLLLN